MDPPLIEATSDHAPSLPCSMAVHTPCPPLVSGPATVVYAMTWLFCIACAAQMYCVSGLTFVSPNPPVVPLGLVDGGAGDAVGVGEVDESLGADVVAGA